MFKPGVSGNPGGRPRREGEVRELARSWTATAISRLAQIVVFGDDRLAIVAAQELLNRGWGRAPEFLAIEDITPPKPSPGIADSMPVEQAAEMYRQMLHSIH